MVSRDFGKLEVRRHLISGIDWAMAGLASAVAASPTPAARRNSRRFMQVPSPVDGDSRGDWSAQKSRRAALSTACHHPPLVELPTFDRRGPQIPSRLDIHGQFHLRVDAAEHQERAGRRKLELDRLARLL